MIKLQRKTFYLNPIAQLYLKAPQPEKTLIGGRGFSKSYCNGISILQKVQELPRSKGLFLGITYTQILSNTLLPMINAWERYGYIQNIHYVIGKRPPKGFETAYQPPQKYDNVITFWNGTTIILGSFDRPQYLRGGSNDWVIVDEALLINKSSYDQIIIPTLRASDIRLKGKPGHLSEHFTSSMPYGTMGAWLLDKEAEAKQHPDTCFYIEGSSWHNRVILGDPVIKKWRRTLPPIIYAIEVMNKKIRNVGNLFYPSLNERHYYTDSYNYDYVDALGLFLNEKNRDSRWDKDCNSVKPVNISFDFGAFNTMTVDQETDREIKFINHFYVTHPEIIDDLVDKFCNYYEHHENKTVFLWGDRSGTKREGNAKHTYFQQIMARLRKNGWRPIMKKVGYVEHLERHRFINVILKEEDPVLPKVSFNRNNCKDLIIALESAPMRDGKKDKRSENNPGIKQQHATHSTDCVDYRLYWGLIDKSKKVTLPPSVSSVSFSH